MSSKADKVGEQIQFHLTAHENDSDAPGAPHSDGDKGQLKGGKVTGIELVWEGRGCFPSAQMTPSKVNKRMLSVLCESLYVCVFLLFFQPFFMREFRFRPRGCRLLRSCSGERRRGPEAVAGNKRPVS